MDAVEQTLLSQFFVKIKMSANLVNSHDSIVLNHRIERYQANRQCDSVLFIDFISNIGICLKHYQHCIYT